MQGIGNDFVVINAEELHGNEDLPMLTRRWSERRFNIGSDGLLVMSRDADGAEFRMRMFNPDGSEDMCGNGLRCACLWAARAGWADGDADFQAATIGGIHQCKLRDIKSDFSVAQCILSMGQPHLKPSEIPFSGPADQRVVDYPLRVDDRTFAVTAMSTSSTHAVIFGELPNDALFNHYSPLIENHPLFPERTNVMWAQQDGDNRFAVRIWERGAHETLGCGTGACAVGVAARLHEFATGENAVQVVSGGGTLLIDWPREGAEIEMTGPAQRVFDGEIAIDA